MACGIIRAEKVKIVKLGSGLQEHHQRSDKDGIYNNPDIDLNLSKNNVEFVHSDNFRESMYQVIKDYNIVRKIRPDAVGLIDGFTAVSGDFFQGKTKEQIVSYFRGMLPFIEKEFGPIISATLHCDEMKYNEFNYHMHFATIPIIKGDNGEYSLSAKKVMGNQKDYIERQDRFYNEYFKNFGLDRGVSAKETKAKHISTNRWKSEQAKQLNDKLKEKAEDLQDDIEDLKLDKQVIILKTKQEQKKLQTAIKQADKATSNLISIDSKVAKKSSEYNNLASGITKQKEIMQKNESMLRSQVSTIQSNDKILKQQTQIKHSLKNDVDDLNNQEAELNQRMDSLFKNYFENYEKIDRIEYISKRLELEYPDYFKELIVAFNNQSYLHEYEDIER